MCCDCIPSSIESIPFLIPHIGGEPSNVNELDVCGSLLPWLIAASKERWFGEVNFIELLTHEKFLYQLLGERNNHLDVDSYRAHLVVQAHHANGFDYEMFSPFFRNLVRAMERRMHDCCACMHEIESNQASLWHVTGTNYCVHLKVEEHPKLLVHSLTLMLTELLD